MVASKKSQASSDFTVFPASSHPQLPVLVLSATHAGTQGSSLSIPMEVSPATSATLNTGNPGTACRWAVSSTPLGTASTSVEITVFSHPSAGNSGLWMWTLNTMQQILNLPHSTTQGTVVQGHSATALSPSRAHSKRNPAFTPFNMTHQAEGRIP